MKIKLTAIIFICLISFGLGMNKNSYGLQIVNQVGADSVDGSSALTFNGSNGWIILNKTWTHSYVAEATNIDTINFATLEIDLLDADGGFLRMQNGGTTIADFNPPNVTQDNGTPGLWRDSTHANANNTTFAIDLPTFETALLSGSFTIAGLNQGMTIWGTNRAILTIDYEAVATAPASVPEPATVALLGIGIAGLAGTELRRRRKKKAVVNS
ncbi:hypothetical protein SCALIN_C04_0121 [Candidatus Scalindua japonica]|uniref:Ice-binding protein C-terminal domain-containing protein n=1 Tax=Candidatus Scalindua japonica TaxID=1284222 RepID=A0A286TUU0_9BACT|nr:PEP-CTERM sorting domain-containing protein [Candidatus Scalindua japonica]GAX59633.1 hypothetical protein SCALIN_C04_0121 [Candidatus Scalindua japonica]